MFGKNAIVGRKLALGLAVVLVLIGGASSTYAQHGAMVAVHGTGISRLPDDTRKLTLNAQTAAVPTAATGFAHFTHQSPTGLSRFRGSVTCLSVNATGSVQISGIVLNGVTAAGVVLTGKAYAFTIDTHHIDDMFSLPKFGDPDTFIPCSGGREVMVPVTEAGFTVEQS